MQVNGSVVSVNGINVQAGSVPVSSPSVANGEADGIPNINISAADGKDGKDGKDGVDGKSAYEQAVEGGFVGTEQEFTKSLNNLNEIKNIMPLVYAGL